MAKRVILALAGAGKTYHICHNINKNKKNLILAYTHENIKNIRNELFNAFGCIPELTTVLTFDSFVYRYLVLPYEPSILQFFQKNTLKTKGITLNSPEKQTINKKPNPKYIKKDEIGHYISKNGFYYCETLSELVMYIKNVKGRLIKKIAKNLNKFYDAIFIDEFQDFREYDFDLITTLAQEIDNIVLVGDYNQHSVSAKNNSGKPFKRGKTEINYNDFKQTISNLGFEIDEKSLQASRRCPKEICDFVREKLKISIVHGNDNMGKVSLVGECDVKNILDDNTTMKLIYKNANKYKFRAMNWSYSKGSTFNSICVILTDNFETLFDRNFSCRNIPQKTINQLYVALTRTKGNLYIIRNSNFKNIRKDYLK